MLGFFLMRFKPFRGLRPRRDLASKVPSYPYDVIDTEGARKLAEGDPYTFLHVVKPEIDLEPGSSPYDDRVYDKGRQNFHAMIEQGWLFRDERPSYYVYRLEMGDHSQRGFVGVAAIDDYLEGTIKKHELTRQDKEQDRVRHMEALSAHAGPVLQAYGRVPELSAEANSITAGDPEVDFVSPDGIRHSLWVVGEREAVERIQDLFSRVPCSYIADGHHRTAAAAEVALKRRREGSAGEDAPHDFFLTVLFPSHQLRILDYNRLVRDLNGLDPAGFLERVRKAGFEIKEGHQARRPPHKRSFGMYLGRSWYLLTTAGTEREEKDPSKRLDVAVLSNRLLDPILGIGDIRTDRRIDFVGGIHGIEELERRVDSGDYAAAFAIYPTAMEEVLSVADAGKVMPPKSTWFEPKLRSGMVVHSLDKLHH